MRVSVIATVKDEYGNLPAWLAGLDGQTRKPDEYVIVDGGSTDGTWELLHAWRPDLPLQLVQLPGVSISQGRNAAIARAQGEVIVVTDAGTIAEPHWLERLLAPLADLNVDVSAGFFRPSGETRWQRSLTAATLPDPSEIDGERFLPSSRSVAFRRTWFDLGLRYPEWLDYCEDLVWDLSMKRAGARFVFSPEALVEFEPRHSWLSFWRQYFHYARGDGKAGLYPLRHAIRYGTYAAAMLTLARHRPAELAFAGLLGCVYVSTSARRLWRRDRGLGLPLEATCTALPLIPLHRLIGDVAKMAGYPRGLLWRWRWFGGIGWRTSWRRISPDGCRWRPESTTTETRPSRASHDAGSPAVLPRSDGHE